MEQTSLDLARTPASRRTDPSTSVAAEEKVTRNGKRGKQQRQVLSLIRRYPGRTSQELARTPEAAAYELDRYDIARRCPELVPVHARDGEARKCEVTGNRAKTWWPKRKQS